MYWKFSTLLAYSLLFVGSIKGISQTLRTADGGGEIEIINDQPCYTPEQEQVMLEYLATERAKLVVQGILPANPGAGTEDLVPLAWPVAPSANFEQLTPYSMNNFVDLDATSGIEDYECFSRSYNGHNGIDINLWPFWWKMMENEEMNIVAAAPGTIVAKFDGNFDMNCDCLGNWNAVYIEHSDGSVAWYGHMKSGTLTSLPVGSSVEVGDYLGLVGSSGCSSNPHLHFELRNADNEVIDPFAGPCNTTTTTSWWADQRDYWDPHLNALYTHDADPVINGFCPSQETPNIATYFDPGDMVRFAGYFHDAQQGDVVNYRILDPSNAEFYAWSHESPDTYIQSHWWFTYAIPFSAELGVWTFEATFHGTVHQVNFYVGEEPNAITETTRAVQDVFPNPSSGELFVEMAKTGTYALQLFDLSGQKVYEGQAVGKRFRLEHPSNLDGIYLLQITDEEGQTSSQRIVLHR